jgi:hypothetical protein
MIFLSKLEPTRRSGKETCLSVLGLLIAIGIVVGLAGLIFGNKKVFFFIYLLD